MHKNDRVLNFPTAERIAEIICNHLDRDDPEVNPPTDSDRELERKIRNEYLNAAYLGYVANDIHGLSLFFRRLIGGALIGVLALILTLTTQNGAH